MDIFVSKYPSSYSNWERWKKVCKKSLKAIPEIGAEGNWWTAIPRSGLSWSWPFEAFYGLRLLHLWLVAAWGAPSGGRMISRRRRGLRRPSGRRSPWAASCWGTWNGGRLFSVLNTIESVLMDWFSLLVTLFPYLEGVTWVSGRNELSSLTFFMDPMKIPFRGLDKRAESGVWHPKNSGSRRGKKVLHFPGFAHPLSALPGDVQLSDSRFCDFH